MSVSLIQKTSGAAASSTSVTATLTGVTAGNTLIAGLVSNSGALIPTSVTDGSGDTVSAAVAFATQVAHAGIGIYYVQNTSAGTHLITVNWGSSNASLLFLAEYSGLLTSGVFDLGSPVSFAASATITTGSITPSVNGELLIFLAGQQNAGETYSAFINGFTQEGSLNSGPSGTWGDLIQTTASAVSGGATSSASNGFGAGVAAFKPAAIPFLPFTRLQWFGEDVVTSF